MEVICRDERCQIIAVHVQGKGCRLAGGKPGKAFKFGPKTCKACGEQGHNIRTCSVARQVQP